MSKIKIAELASELGVESKELVTYLQDQGVEAAKRSTSSIEDDDAEKVRKHFGSGSADAKKEKAPEKEQAPAKEEAPKAKPESGDQKGQKPLLRTPGRQYKSY